MLIHLYGPDAYRRKQKLQEIVSAYEKKHSALTRGVFYLDETEALDRLRLFLGSQSLFDAAKLAVVYGLADAPSEFPKFLKTFLQHTTTTIVAISEKKLGKEFAFLLKKPSISQSFDPLTASALSAFIKTESEHRGLALTADMLRYISQAFQSDTWRIVTEIEKLSLGGEAGQATAAIPAFFPLVQSFKNGRSVESRLVALGYLLESGDPAAVFNITASIADSRLKIKMADMDVAIKSGKLEYAEALTDLALQGL